MAAKKKVAPKVKRKPGRPAYTPEQKQAARDKRNADKRDQRAASGGTNKRAAKSLESLKEEGHGICLSIEQAALEFQRDASTIRRRIIDCNIRPAAIRSSFPVYSLRSLLEMENMGPDGKIDPEKLRPFDRKAHYQADGERIKLQVLCKELLHRTDVEIEWGRVLKVVKQALDTLVDIVDRDVAPSPIVLERISKCVDAVREDMAEAIANGGPAVNGSPRTDALVAAINVIRLIAEMPVSTHEADATLCKEWLAEHQLADTESTPRLEVGTDGV